MEKVTIDIKEKENKEVKETETKKVEKEKNMEKETKKVETETKENKNAEKENKEVKETENKEAKKEVNEKDIIDEAKKTGAKLNKEVKVRIKVPVDQLNPKDLMVPVVVNGYQYLIKRGETVEVPEVVANILEEAKYI